MARVFGRHHQQGAIQDWLRAPAPSRPPDPPPLPPPPVPEPAVTIPSPPPGLRARFIREIGLRGRLHIYWENVRVEKISEEDGYRHLAHLGGCPSSYGKPGQNGVHNAYVLLGDKQTNDFGSEAQYPDGDWPTACKHCGAPVPAATELRDAPVGAEGARVVRQVFVSRLYDSPSGEPEPGDIYFLSHDQCHYWDNCAGPHLYGVLPNGHRWDIDSRASNCDKQDDRAHRCWIRHGTPPDVTVDKSGVTCGAGAGSILVPGWHGYLRDGMWVT